jgi:hypothetical protein
MWFTGICKCSVMINEVYYHPFLCDGCVSVNTVVYGICKGNRPEKKATRGGISTPQIPSSLYLVIHRRSIGSSLFRLFSSMSALKHGQYWAGNRRTYLWQMKGVTSPPNNPSPATDEISRFETWMFVMSEKSFMNSMGSIYHLLCKLFY